MGFGKQQKPINDEQQLSEKPVKSEQKQVIRDGKGRFPEGVSGNPEGRPPGTYSLKTKIIKKLQENPDLEASVIDAIISNEKSLLWQMIDGRPSQDVTSKGEKIIPNPIYGKQSVQVSGYDSDSEDIQPSEED